MNAHAYVRVSSKAQDVAMQRAAIEGAAAARGDSIGRWWEEKRSGKTLARPALDEMRAAARAGQVRRLYVFRLDRLTRSGIRDTFELVEEFKTAQVELVSVRDGFALDGPAAEVVLAVMAWAAKMERLAINERIAAARENVEAKGGSWGRPLRLDAPQLAQARDYRMAGRSLRWISAALKVPRATLARALSRKDGTEKGGSAPSDKPPPSR